MARDPDHRTGSFETENTGGLLTGFLAEEDDFDRRALWRLGSWGAASVAAVIVALLANQSSIGWRRNQVASTDLSRQSQQIQSVAKESQSETRRLTSAIDTLNSDRDRLYSRVTLLELGLDSVTGSIARQNSAAASPQAVAMSSATSASSATTEPQPVSQNPAPPAAVAPPATTAAATVEKPPAVAAAGEPGPATVSSAGQGISKAPTPAVTPSTPLMASKSIMAPPDTAAAKLIDPEKPASVVTAAPMPEVVASVAPAGDAEPDGSQATSPTVAVQRTEFGVDVGGANSVGGLRALWRGLLKSRSNAPLTTLRPIIVVKEGNNGLGMQLRLVAGPLNDAAAAAKICAKLIESQRTCETTVFDGQRLAMKVDEPPTSAKPVARRRSVAKRAVVEEPPKQAEEPPKQPEASTLSSIFGRKPQ